MRITTQMLNNTARRAGLPIHNNSLLSVMNNDNSQSSLLEALNKKKKTATNILDKNQYEELEKAAKDFEKQNEKLTKSGEESLFEKIRQSGTAKDKQELYDSIGVWVERFNLTTEELQRTTDGLNGFYHEMLKESVNENKEALEQMGITVKKDGTLNLDKEKLKEASLEDVEKLLGTDGVLSSKMKFLADRIADNANANAQSLTSQYNSNGNVYSTLSSQYDFWG